jgi:hypothetical protein
LTRSIQGGSTIKSSVFLLGVAAVAIGVLPGPVPLVPAHLLDPVLGSAMQSGTVVYVCVFTPLDKLDELELVRVHGNGLPPAELPLGLGGGRVHLLLIAGPPRANFHRDFLQQKAKRQSQGISSGATYFGRPKYPFASRGGRESDRFCPRVSLHLGVTPAARRISAFA